MKKSLPSLFSGLAVVALMAAALIPLYFLVVTALSTPSWQSVLRPELYLGNFLAVWQKTDFGRALWVSAAITILALAITLLFASSAAYAFARFGNRFYTAVFTAFLVAMMVPAIVYTVPLYSLMRKLGGINTIWGMGVLLATGALPMATFLYKSFIQALPKEMEEAALVDGCTRYVTYWLIVLPMLKTVTATVIILNVVSFWNNYNLAVFFLQMPHVRSVPLAIASFVQTYTSDWNSMAAGALMSILPAVTVFLLFQKQFTKGIALGALKG